jgi:hypothetical protein
MTDVEAFAQGRVFRESRRSTRVHLKVAIEAQGVAEHLTCEGETIIVNLHGALISTSAALSVGMKIEIHVYLTGKQANAEGRLRRSRAAPALRNRVSDTTQHLGNIVATKRLA